MPWHLLKKHEKRNKEFVRFASEHFFVQIYIIILQLKILKSDHRVLLPVKVEKNSNKYSLVFKNSHILLLSQIK